MTSLTTAGSRRTRLSRYPMGSGSRRPVVVSGHLSDVHGGRKPLHAELERGGVNIDEPAAPPPPEEPKKRWFEQTTLVIGGAILLAAVIIALTIVLVSKDENPSSEPKGTSTYDLAGSIEAPSCG